MRQLSILFVENTQVWFLSTNFLNCFYLMSIITDFPHYSANNIPKSTAHLSVHDCITEDHKESAALTFTCTPPPPYISCFPGTLFQYYYPPWIYIATSDLCSMNHDHDIQPQENLWRSQRRRVMRCMRPTCWDSSPTDPSILFNRNTMVVNVKMIQDNSGDKVPTYGMRLLSEVDTAAAVSWWFFIYLQMVIKWH